MHLIQDSTELPDSQAMLRVSHLQIQHGAQALVQDLSFELHAGQALAVVGESGSGKSISSLALLGLLPENLQVSGQALLQGQDLLALSQEQYRQVRGHKIAMIFQEPMTALNPLHRVEKIIGETLLLQEMARQTGIPVGHTRLIRAIGHQPDYFDPRRLATQIHRLRDKPLRQCGKTLPIESVYARGYALTEPLHIDGEHLPPHPAARDR